MGSLKPGSQETARSFRGCERERVAARPSGTGLLTRERRDDRPTNFTGRETRATHAHKNHPVRRASLVGGRFRALVGRPRCSATARRFRIRASQAVDHDGSHRCGHREENASSSASATPAALHRFRRRAPRFLRLPPPRSHRPGPAADRQFPNPRGAAASHPSRHSRASSLVAQPRHPYSFTTGNRATSEPQRCSRR